MLYANLGGNRIIATPNTKAQCPVCSNEVFSKCGEIYTWHWAHIAGADCDSWYEPESEWHRKWKERFPEHCREVTTGNHRADIRLQLDLCKSGNIMNRVIELQASTLSVEEIREREAFYGEMYWLVRGDEFADRFDILTSDRGHNHIWSQFNWKHAQVSWAYATKPVFIDFGGKLFQIVHMGTRLSDMERQVLDGNGYGKWVPAQILVDTQYCYQNLYEKFEKDFSGYFKKTIVKFGKYKDQPASVMIQDHGYCTWFLSQPDLRERYSWLAHFIMNVRP